MRFFTDRLGRGSNTGNAPANQQSAARAHNRRDLRVGQSAMMSAMEFDSHKLIDKIGATANANGVTLYPLQGGAFSQSGDGDVENARQAAIASTFVAARVNSAAALKVMAEQTGGVVSAGSKHDDLFEQIRSDLESYYSLAFKPTGIGERDIQVRVKKPGRYTVRARRSYVQKTNEQDISDRVVANLLTKLRATDAEVRITTDAEKTDAEGKVIVPVKIHVPYDSLTLVEQDSGHTGGDVYIVAVDAAGAMSPVIHRAQRVEVAASQLDQTKGTTYTYALNFRMNRNVQRVSVAVVDAVTQVPSFARYEVPAE